MDSTWVQFYNPLGSAWLSTLAAAVPLVLLLGLLLLGTSAPRAALSGLLAAFAVAVFVYHMPCRLAIAAAAYGACFGLLPIGWIVLAAVFLYHLTVRSGQFEIVKRSVAAISPDRRIQALLIAFSFGTFLEGCGVRDSGGDLLGTLDRAGVPPLVRGRHRPAGEYRAGGVRLPRHTDPRLGQDGLPGPRCRNIPNGPVADGGPPIGPLLPDHSVLARGRDVRAGEA